MSEYQVEITHELTRGGHLTLQQFGDGYLPSRFTARLSGGGITGDVILRIRVDGELGPGVESYTHQAPQGGFLDPSSQRLPLGRLHSFAVMNAVLRPSAASTVVMPGPALRRRVDDDHLREVARIHAEGGRRGTAAVVEAFGVSRATASRWVAEAASRLRDG